MHAHQLIHFEDILYRSQLNKEQDRAQIYWHLQLPHSGVNSPKKGTFHKPA